MELSACGAMDGAGDGAATAIAAVKPCALGAPLRGLRAAGIRATLASE